jgi:predicted DNA-binding antitoxin AbrB/MazE fold protein
MSERIAAVFENGIFRPEMPVPMLDGQRVSLNVEPSVPAADDLGDVIDLLDTEYMQACEGKLIAAPSLEEVRKTLSPISGSLADRIAQDR